MVAKKKFIIILFHFFQYLTGRILKNFHFWIFFSLLLWELAPSVLVLSDLCKTKLYCWRDSYITVERAHSISCLLDLYSKNIVFCFQDYFNQLWKKSLSDWQKLLQFEAEGREFAKMLRSLEQFIWILKGQFNFWNRKKAFITCSWRFFRSMYIKGNDINNCIFLKHGRQFFSLSIQILCCLLEKRTHIKNIRSVEGWKKCMKNIAG